MYENQTIKEPKWKNWIIRTTTPLFTPDQCNQIIASGRAQKPQTAQVFTNKTGGVVTNKLGGRTDTKKRVTTISWIPFKEMGHMYQDLNAFIQKSNENHFGFGDVRVTENAQFTEYPEGGFYDWHMDCDVSMEHEPPVRKISMTLLLNDPAEFEGGELELMGPGKVADLKQGHAICFASFLNHRVQPVTKGVRQSLVVWFGGKPFR